MIPILYKREYYGRLIFIAEIDNRPFIGYRSSGLAGHDSKGVVLPTYFLKDKDGPTYGDEFNNMVVGWLPKICMVNHTPVPYYSKTITSFPMLLQPILVELTEQLKDVTAEAEISLEIKDYAELINAEMREIIGARELYSV